MPVVRDGFRRTALDFQKDNKSKVDTAGRGERLRSRKYVFHDDEKNPSNSIRGNNMADDIINPPVRGNRLGFTGSFGEPRGDGRHPDRRHLGTDFGAQTPGVAGDDIVAATSGKLIYRGPAGIFGNIAVIEKDNGDGTYSYFPVAHMLEAEKPNSSGSGALPAIGSDVQVGKTIGQMGNTGSSAGGRPVPVHAHIEQINTNGRLNFSHGWPLGKGPSGVTPSGVAWERVGPSFQLPNGWVARSDNGRISVTLLRCRLLVRSRMLRRNRFNAPISAIVAMVISQARRRRLNPRTLLQASPIAFQPSTVLRRHVQ